MSDTSLQTWGYRFHDTLKLAYQQKGSLVANIMDPGMIHRDVAAMIDHHERLGNVMANDSVSPFAPTTYLNPEHSRRAVRLQSSDATVAISDENTLRSMVDPQNGYTQTIVSALGRRADKHVIDALTGSADVASVTAGTGVITYSSSAFPSARIVGGASAMDLNRIISASEKLAKAGVPQEMGALIMLYSPGQRRDLLAITQASSSDFTKNQIHDRGTINGVTWEGFLWIEIADVIAVDASTVLGRMLNFTAGVSAGLDIRACLAFHKSAVGLSYGKDLTTKVDAAPWLQSRPTQVRTSMMMAAVRVFEGGVIQVNAKEN